MAHLKVFGRFVREFGSLALKQHHIADRDLFLRAAYRALLGRELDQAGRQYYLRVLEQRRMGRWTVLHSILASDEFKERYDTIRAGHVEFLTDVYCALLMRRPDEYGMAYYLPALLSKRITRQDVLQSIIHSNEFRQVYGLPVHPLDAAHQARMLLFQQCLPPAQIILDLGGAAHDYAEGALLAMGYPYRPQEIHIIDLPPAERLGGAEHAEPTQEHQTEDGVHIVYHYQSMTELATFAGNSVDLVVSGESIEHIMEEDADIVCQETYRVLKPGGYFCLDTPNAALTRLQSPHELIHPEHKKEYYVHELREKLERYGFDIVEAKGICPMPQSLASGNFDFAELTGNIGLSDDPEAGYMFFLKARKIR